MGQPEQPNFTDGEACTHLVAELARVDCCRLPDPLRQAGGAGNPALGRPDYGLANHRISTTPATNPPICAQNAIPGSPKKLPTN